MWRPARGANHYALRAWVDVDTGSSGSEVDAAGTSVRNLRVRGKDPVRWGGSTSRISRKIKVSSNCAT